MIDRSGIQGKGRLARSQLILLSILPLLISSVSYGRAKPNKRGRPQELRGTIEQRMAQNKKAEALGIKQIATDDELVSITASGLLVKLGETDGYFVDLGRSPVKKRRGKKIFTIEPCSKISDAHTFPHIKAYVDRLAHDYFKEVFGKKHRREASKLKISSAARSLEHQRKMRSPGTACYTPYAARVPEPLAESLHVRGLALDISLRGVSAKGKKWLRKRLIADKKAGIVEVEEEIDEVGIVDELLVEVDPIEESTCFHIVIFPKTKAI